MALWLVRAGKYGEQQDACLNNNIVTIGWNDLPDLTSISDWTNLKELYRKTYPDEKEGTVKNRAGQVFAFAHKIKEGDLVVLPIKGEPFISIGEVKNKYQFTKKYGNDVRHAIPVEWLNKEIPRSRFDQDLLYSFGAFMTVCQIDRNDAEARVRAILKSKNVQSQENNEFNDDDTEYDLAGNSRDQIYKQISKKFKGHALEELVEAILQAQGFITNRTDKGADGGADILAGSGILGFESPRILVEVKSEDGAIGGDVIDRMRGALDKFSADYGLCVSLNGFKQGVKKQNRNAYFKIRLWDSVDLIDNILKFYDKLPESIQAELPLQKTWVYVPSED
jgi:restriction system protein